MSALVVALFFNLTNLIAISVFFLGICYLLTAASALRLVRRAPESRLRVAALPVLFVLGGLGGIYLSLQAPAPLIAIGTVVMLVGLVLYGWRMKAWREAAEVRVILQEDEQRLVHWARQREVWLLRFTQRR